MHPIASVHVLNEEHVAVVVAATAYDSADTAHFSAGDRAVFSFAFENVLAPGRYRPVFIISHRGTGMDLMDRFEGASSFVVSGPEALGGLVDVPVTVSVGPDAMSAAHRIRA